MVILNRFSAILICCDSTHFLLLSLRNFWQFQTYDSGNRAIRNSRFCAAKPGTPKRLQEVSLEKTYCWDQF